MNNIDRICEYFLEGCNENQRIGMELEHFVCDEEDMLIPYEKICELFVEAQAVSGGTIYREHGHIFGLQCERYALTLEPAGQLEISMEPTESIAEMEEIYAGFRHIWDRLLSERGYHLEEKGVFPLVENGEKDPEDFPLIPKKRYEYMDRYFRDTGSYGAYMMRSTASTQVSLDYASEEDAMDKQRVLQILSPLLSLFMENQSGLGRRKGFRKHLLRTQIWNDVDGQRCGILPGSLHPKYTFADYASYVYENPLIFLKTPEQELEVKEKSARDLCIEEAWRTGEEGETAITWIDHMLSMFFPHVRLKQYVELRAADSVPIERALGYAALVKGLMYGAGNLDILKVIFQDVTEISQIREAEASIMEDGYYGKVYGEELAVELLDILVDLAKKGLSVEERGYLERALPLPLLEWEYTKTIKKNQKAHESTAQEAKEYILHSTAKYHNRVPRTMYIPKMFTREDVRYFSSQMEILFGIFEKVMKEYRDNPDYRRLFGFDPLMEELILKEEAYSVPVPMARIDIFYDEETREFHFCEFNTDGTSAMNEDRELNKAVKLTLAYQEFAKAHSIHTFELFDSWVEEFIKIYEEYAARYGRKPVPNVVIADFLERATYSEFQIFQEHFQARGIPCEICDIRKIHWDGQYCYTPEGKRIDAIYRRAVTSDILTHREEVSDLIEAVRQNGVCLVGEFRTQIVHNKILYKILHLPETGRLLTTRERRYVKAHVPYTVSLTQAFLETHPEWKEDVLTQKDHWIIKPEDSYGSYGVHAGVECGQEQWNEYVEQSCDQGYILQQFCTPYRLPNADLLNADESQRRWCTTSNLTGLFVYCGKLKGIYSRTSFSQMISTQYNEMSAATIIVE